MISAWWLLLLLPAFALGAIGGIAYILMNLNTDVA